MGPTGPMWSGPQIPINPIQSRWVEHAGDGISHIHGYHTASQTYTGLAWVFDGRDRGSSELDQTRVVRLEITTP